MTDLNGKLWPLGTTTYPVTRGMQVEIAAIIIICALALVSQFRLWRVVRERREQRAAEKREQDLERDQAEEDFGRRFEAANNQDRVRWEAIFGDRPRPVHQSDSGIGTDTGENSPRKNSTSIIETREFSNGTDGYEMAPLNAESSGSSSRQQSGDYVRRSSIGDRRYTNMTEENLRLASQRLSQVHELPEDGVHELEGSGQTTATETPETVPSNEILNRSADEPKPSAPTPRLVLPGPKVVPLPFHVPVGADSDDEDKHSSAASRADSDIDDGQQRDANYLSGNTNMHPWQASAKPTQSREALIVPYSDRSRTSSVDAAFDNDLDAPSSRALSINGDDVKAEEAIIAQDDGQDLLEPEPGLKPKTAQVTSTVTETPYDLTPPEDASQKVPLLESDDRTIQQSPYASSLYSRRVSKTEQPSEPSLKRGGVNRKRDSTQQSSQDSPSTSEGPEKTRSRAASDVSSRRSSKRSLKSGAIPDLPAHTARIINTYRTNEWAKYLDGAEPPQDQIVESPIDADEQPMRLDESPSPVDVDALLQTATTARLPPYAKKSTSQAKSKESQPSGRSSSEFKMSGPSRKPSSKLTSDLLDDDSPKRQSSGRAAWWKSPSRTEDAASKPSYPSVSVAKGRRTASVPLMEQSLVESPIEEDAEASFSPRNTSSPLPSSTLMGKRSTMLQNKVSSLSMSQVPSPTTVSPDPSPTSSGPASRRQSLDDENLPLSQRRRLLKLEATEQQLTSNPNSKRQGKRAATHDSTMVPRQINPQPAYEQDTHRQQAMMASFRESVRHDVNVPRQRTMEAEKGRSLMMQQQQQAAANKYQAKVMQNQRSEMFDLAMRSREDMQQAHRESMRKMQGIANKHV